MAIGENERSSETKRLERVLEEARAQLKDAEEAVGKQRGSIDFGRIDFRDDHLGDPDSIYVGISSLVDRTGREHLVYDWRAPISSLFYDAEPGLAGYDTEAGSVTGEVTLKRQYKLVDGRLRYLFDTNVTIEDELLQEILSKSADSTMRNIVTTIP